LRIQVFWDVTPYHWVSDCQCFEGLLCLHLQGLRIQAYTPQLLKIQKSCCNLLTHCHILEDLNPQQNCHVNIKH